jgi:hypothetical protein
MQWKQEWDTQSLGKNLEDLEYLEASIELLKEMIEGAKSSYLKALRLQDKRLCVTYENLIAELQFKLTLHTMSRNLKSQIKAFNKKNGE